jgi:hypothetical protein
MAKKCKGKKCKQLLNILSGIHKMDPKTTQHLCKSKKCKNNLKKIKVIREKKAKFERKLKAMTPQQRIKYLQARAAKRTKKLLERMKKMTPKQRKAFLIRRRRILHQKKLRMQKSFKLHHKRRLSFFQRIKRGLAKLKNKPWVKKILKNKKIAQLLKKGAKGFKSLKGFLSPKMLKGIKKVIAKVKANKGSKKPMIKSYKIQKGIKGKPGMIKHHPKPHHVKPQIKHHPKPHNFRPKNKETKLISDARRETIRELRRDFPKLPIEKIRKIVTKMTKKPEN